MKHITLTTVETLLHMPKKVTINPDHLVSLEPDGDYTLVLMYKGEAFHVQESEEKIRELIAAGEAKPAPEPPKEPKA